MNFQTCWGLLLTFKIVLRNGYELMEFNPRGEWELNKKYVGSCLQMKLYKELPWVWLNALWFYSHEICVPGCKHKGKCTGSTYLENLRFILYS